MADQTRTFEIRFDTRRAIDALQALDRAIEGVDRSADDASRAVRGIASSRNLRQIRRLSRNLDGIARGVSRGFGMASAAVAGFGMALSKVIDIGADFEQGITNAAVKFPEQIRKGTEAYDRLESKALEFGKTTEFTSTQAAKSLEFFAMAGFTAEQAMVSLAGAGDLATVSGLKLDRAADIATDTLGAFGMATKDAVQQGINLTRVNDVLASTSTNANTTVSEMFEAIKQGGSTAAASGVNIETYSALLSSMANAGIKGGKAGRTLKNVFLRLQAPAKAGARQLERLFGKNGLINESTGRLEDPIKIIGMLNQKLVGMGDASKAKILNDIFGKIALPGSLVLLKSGNEELEKFRQNALRATGASAEMAAIMRSTTRGSINALNSAIEGLIISFFKLEDSGIKNTIDAMTEWIRVNEQAILQGVGDWLDKVIDNWDKIVKVIEDAAIVLGTGGAFWLALKAIETAVALFTLGPIGVAFALAVAAVAVSVSDMRDLGLEWEEILLRMSITTDAVIDSIKTTFNGLIDAVNYVETIARARNPADLLDAIIGRDVETGVPKIERFKTSDRTEKYSRLKDLVDERYDKLDSADYQNYFKQTYAYQTEQNVKKYGGAAGPGVSDIFSTQTQNQAPRVTVSIASPIINTGADAKSVHREMKKWERRAGKDLKKNVLDAYLGGS